tara:strand:- start:178 stop:2295 length:2118 start_codon:yes stop_codon:yes gene_type:complete
MNKVYNSLYQSYYDKGLPVTPVMGKRPLIKDWQILEHDSDTQTGTGIGLITGERSDVICLDIDIVDKKLKEEIELIIETFAPSPCGRFGNKEKPAARFYTLTKEFNKKLLLSTIGIEDRIELLTSGQQVVLPPSSHPDFDYNYEWSGTPLIDFNLEFLPALNMDTWNKISKAFYNRYPKTSGSTTEYGGKGRHLDLIDIAGSMVGRNESQDFIISELLKNDKEKHDTPYFSDPTEHRTNQDYVNASAMVQSVISTHVQNGGTYDPTLPTISIKESAPIINQERVKFPKFRGIAQKMFEHLYAESHVPRSRLAIPSILSLMSVALGNKIRLRNTYPNLYCMMIAKSGYGKDIPLNYPSDILNKAGSKSLMGEGDYGSDTGLLQSISDTNKTRLHVIDECSKFFGTTQDYGKAAYAAKMADVYAELYTRPGKQYYGKTLAKGNVGACYSPYVSMLCATTPDGFSETVTRSTIQKGLGARFLFFFDDAKKRAPFMFDAKDAHHLDEDVIGFIKQWRGVLKHESETDVEQKTPPREIDISPEAIAELKLVHELVEDHKENSEGILTPIYNRLEQNILKLCIIDAVSISYDPFNPDAWPKIKKESVVWAWKFAQAYLTMMEGFIGDHVAQGEQRHESIARARILKTLSNHPSGIVKQVLSKKLYKKGIKSKLREEILKDLVTCGEVFIFSNTAKKPSFISAEFVKGECVP